MKDTDINLVVIGGTGRNVGKTEFACRLIAKVSAEREVYGLKVSAIFPDESSCHGNHLDSDDSSRLYRENRITGSKDTSRMLAAGATEVYYIRGEEADILPHYQEFRSRIPKGAVVVCESNSLGHLVAPCLRIAVTVPGRPVKPRAVELLKNADLVVRSDTVSGFPELARIGFVTGRGWLLGG